MKPLVLAGWPMSEFIDNGLADIWLDLALFRFTWEQQPSADDLAAYLGPRSADPNRGNHWSGWGGGWKQSNNNKYSDLGLAEFCQCYETVELWFDMRPYAQLKLVWLLDYFKSHPEAVSRLKLRLVDQEMIGIGPDGMDDWSPPIVEVTEKELATASVAWQAYRSSTPEACLELLQRDLSVLPLLKPALLDLLAELPSASTGLGATEMRMLEMIGRGYSRSYDLFYRYDVRQTRVFGETECAHLLEGLAYCSEPAVVGLDDELRTLPKENLRDRFRAHQRTSRLSLTDFGKAVVAHKEDFSRYNPIDRWWGGTHLTNDNLWRWSPVLVKP